MNGAELKAVGGTRLTRVLGVVDVRILGPIEVVDSDGRRRLPVAGMRPKGPPRLLRPCVLPHGCISSDRILDEVWQRRSAGLDGHNAPGHGFAP